MLGSEITSDIRLRSIRYQPSATGRENENASDDFLFVLPLTHGRLKLERDDVVLHDGPVQPGTVRVVVPGERSRLTPRSAFESVMLMVPGLSLRNLARMHGLTFDGESGSALPPLMNARHDVQRLIPLLRTASELPGPQRSLLMAGLVMALLALILDLEESRGADRGPGFAQEEFEQVLAFGVSRLGEKLDLAEWADVLQLSTNEFARRFQQHTGVAPYTWFMDRRIDEAKRLMVDSEIALVDIALDAGFCSQSHFTEAFRRRVGTSPGRWRTAQGGPAA